MSSHVRSPVNLGIWKRHCGLMVTSILSNDKLEKFCNDISLVTRRELGTKIWDIQQILKLPKAKLFFGRKLLQK